MTTQTHLDVDMLLEKIKHVFDFFNIKLFGSALCSYFVYCFNDKYTIITSLFVLIFFDTLTGIWCAIKTKEVSSRGFYRVTIKCFVYFVMIIVARVVDKNIPLPFAAVAMDSFLVITEAISILENIGKLGFMVPQVIISKLKALQKVEKQDDVKNN